MWTVKRSKIHGSGVFAQQNISKGSNIIQYIGEKVSKKEGDRRSEKRLKKYMNSKVSGSVYIFELNITQICSPIMKNLVSTSPTTAHFQFGVFRQRRITTKPPATTCVGQGGRNYA